MDPPPELLRGSITAILRPTTRMSSFVLKRQSQPGSINLVGPERAKPDHRASKIRQRPRVRAPLPGRICH
jgi:hypothetical protein